MYGAEGMFEEMSEFARNAWIIYLVFYVVQAIALFKIGQKANVKNPWVAFIPVLQYIVYLHIIDKSGWAILLLLIPVVNIVLSIIWAVKFYLAFSVSTVMIVLSIIVPVVGLVMMLLIAFSEKYTYGRTTRFAA